MTRRRILVSLAIFCLVAIGGGVAFWARLQRAPHLPPLTGRLVYVSDRTGRAELFLRMLDSGEERQLTHLTDPVGEPALAPDGRRVAFSMGGRIGVADLASGEARIYTLGVAWRDRSPAWRPDGGALVVASRRAPNEPSDIHELIFDGAPDAPMGIARRPLTQTPGLAEESPLYGADGRFVLFVREENIFRLDLGDDHPRRLTGGFKKCRAPARLPDGRVVFAWSLAKVHGLDRMDADGKNRETLAEGSVFYRTLAPSPDGRFIAATYTFDLAFQPSAALRMRQTEELRLLDARGAPIGTLASSWRFANAAPSWGP